MLEYLNGRTLAFGDDAPVNGDDLGVPCERLQDSLFFRMFLGV